MLTACINFAVAPVPGGVAPWRNLLAILDADLTSSPQPPHLNEFLAESVPNESDVAVKDEGEIKADGDGGSLRGGVAQEQAARLPRAHPLASLQTAAAADIAYTNACSLVPVERQIAKYVKSSLLSSSVENSTGPLALTLSDLIF